MPKGSVSKSALRLSAFSIPPIFLSSGFLVFFHVSFLSYFSCSGLKLLKPNINSWAVCALMREDALVLWTAEAHGHCSITCLSWGGHSTLLQPTSQRWLCFSAGHGQKKNANLNYFLTLAKSRELRRLLWCKWQFKLTCSHMELRDL